MSSDFGIYSLFCDALKKKRGEIRLRTFSSKAITLLILGISFCRESGIVIRYKSYSSSDAFEISNPAACSSNRITSCKMSSFKYLDLQHNLSKSKILRRPSRVSSSLSKQFSELALLPNKDELKHVFDKFDTNKDGKISQCEYKAVLRALGKENLIADVLNIFRFADLDGDGYINFEEFVEAHKGGVRTRDIQSAFWTFDLNGDGKITVDEVMQVLRSLGEWCSLEDCQRMVCAVDADGDGMVNMDEFITMMTRTLHNN